MKGVALFLAGIALVVETPASGQSEQERFTPTGSRIARPIDSVRMTVVNRERVNSVLGRFASCIYDRSPGEAASLIARTDYGFTRAVQVGLTNEDLDETFGFSRCLGREQVRSNRGLELRMSGGNVRAMLVQQAYFEKHPEGPTWVREGYGPGDRMLPLSADVAGVRSALDFADCVVASDPYQADLFYRSAGAGEAEKQALEGLVPLLGPCLVEGIQIELTPSSLRAMLGEALWHAATASRPLLAGAPEVAE